MNIALINFGSFSNDPLEHHHRSNDCVRWWDDSIGILERGGDISYSTEWLEYHHRYWHRHNGCVRWFSWDTGTRGTYFLLTSGLSTITDPCTWLCDMILSGFWNEEKIFPSHQWLEYHHRSWLSQMDYTNFRIIDCNQCTRNLGWINFP